MKNVFLYCRKSTESEDRQVISIDSQKAELKKFADSHNLHIVEIFTESKSAKEPGRPIFNEMMARVYKGEVSGILCWKIDRLARNPVDGGSVIWSLKSNGIQIHTPAQTYTQDNDSVVMMYLEFGMAQKYIDDLSKNVKRGLKTKVEMGWYPSLAPLGYLNQKTSEYKFPIIVKDPLRYERIQNIFKQILEGRQPAYVWRKATEDKLLNTKNGKSLPYSSFYALLNNPFYSGTFEYPQGSSNFYIGKHEAMLSGSQHQKVLIILHNKFKNRRRVHNIDLTNVFKCGECGSQITATKKLKYYPRTNNFAEYIYYHCTQISKKSKCSQKPIAEKDLVIQLNDLFGKLDAPEDFYNWAKKWLKVLHEQESHEMAYNQNIQNSELVALQTKMDKLLNLHLDEKIDTETYERNKKEIQKQIIHQKELLGNTYYDRECWHEKVEESLNIAQSISKKFKIAEPEEKRSILNIIGSNFILKDKKAYFKTNFPYSTYADSDKWEKQKNEWIEPAEYTNIIVKNPELQPDNLVWLGCLDSNQE